MSHLNSLTTEQTAEPMARMVGGSPFITIHSKRAGRTRTRTSHRAVLALLAIFGLHLAFGEHIVKEVGQDILDELALVSVIGEKGINTVNQPLSDADLAGRFFTLTSGKLTHPLFKGFACPVFFLFHGAYYTKNFDGMPNSSEAGLSANFTNTIGLTARYEKLRNHACKTI